MDDKIIKLSDEAKNILNNYNNSVDVKKIIKNLANGKILKKDYIFWPVALISYGLLLQEDKSINKIVINQIAKFKKKKYKITNFDDALMIYLVIRYNDKLKIKDIDIIKEKMFEMISSYKNKVIPYRNTDSNEIFVDLLGMVPPFLCSYSIENENLDWMLLQYEEFIKNGFDVALGLPFHSYNKMTNNKNGIVGWSRSLGWILFGLSECIDYLYDKNNIYYNKLLNYYTYILDNTVKYIRKDGGYSWQLISKEGHLDTSGTSMILLSMLTLRKKKIILDKYDSYIKSNILCLENNIVDGKVMNCSSECRGLGIYPQVYGSYAWSVGPTLCSLIIYNKIFKNRKEKICQKKRN